MARGGAGQFNVTRLFADYDADSLGKKDDDHGRAAAAASRSNPQSAATWSGKILRHRYRKRWLAIGGLAFLLWYMLWGVPAEWWEPNRMGFEETGEIRNGAPNGRVYPPPRLSSSTNVEEAGPPPRPNGKQPVEDIHYYDGDISFPKLTYSLQSSQRTQGFRKFNQNILFVGSNPKSFASLIPLACEMAKAAKNTIHVAIVGRSDLDFDEIIRLNGIDKEECTAYWHDARPKWAIYSSDARTENSIGRALGHLHESVHPQAVITDDSALEDAAFTRQMRTKSNTLEWPVIELPADASERLQWISRLDSKSLRVFHRTTIDILVQAPKGEAGSLMRLLKSLAAADYKGVTPPKLTIELPPDIDPILGWYLANYQWPPQSSAFQPMLGSLFSVRHRIPDQSLSPEEAAVRFMESFYPMSENSHVLVLNPNVELSPPFYHWLKYYVLHYKASRLGFVSSSELLGLSLYNPSTYLNGTTNFVPPDTFDEEYWDRSNPEDEATKPPFAWQAPGADAALYFGDKWAEVHDFVRHRLHKARDGKRFKKVVGEHLPAWTEYMLEFMRSRGWSILYPASGQNVKTMATLHGELQKPPEEFAEAYLAAKAESSEESNEAAGKLSTRDEASKRDSADGEPKRNPESPLSETHQPLHMVLPFLGEEPLVSAVPHLLYDGSLVAPEDIFTFSEEYAQLFRRDAGDCEIKKGKYRKIVFGKAADLFCWGTEDASEWVEIDTPGGESETINQL